MDTYEESNTTITFIVTKELKSVGFTDKQSSFGMF